jgi:hypothetical protein
MKKGTIRETGGNILVISINNIEARLPEKLKREQE